MEFNDDWYAKIVRMLQSRTEESTAELKRMLDAVLAYYAERGWQQEPSWPNYCGISVPRSVTKKEASRDSSDSASSPNASPRRSSSDTASKVTTKCPTSAGGIGLDKEKDIGKVNDSGRQLPTETTTKVNPTTKIVTLNVANSKQRELPKVPPPKGEKKSLPTAGKIVDLGDLPDVSVRDKPERPMQPALKRLKIQESSDSESLENSDSSSEVEMIADNNRPVKTREILLGDVEGDVIEMEEDTIDVDPADTSPACTACGTPSTAGNGLVQCQDCSDYYHKKCHDPPISNAQASDPRLLWYCHVCTNKQKKLQQVKTANVVPVGKPVKELTLTGKPSAQKPPVLVPSAIKQHAKPEKSLEVTGSTKQKPDMASLAASFLAKAKASNPGLLKQTPNPSPVLSSSATFSKPTISGAAVAPKNYKGSSAVQKAGVPVDLTKRPAPNGSALAAMRTPMESADKRLQMMKKKAAAQKKL